MKAENKISLLSLFVAACALSLTIWQGIESRNHNRLVVKPRLTIYDDHSAFGSGLFFKNIGLGPAIFRAVIFKDGDKVLETKEFTKYLQERIPISLRKHGFYVRRPGKNQAIEAEGSPCMILGTKDTLEPEEMIMFLEAIKNFYIKIVYESMYGDLYVVDYKVDYIPSWQN